jgi:hypothetical protein
MRVEQLASGNCVALSELWAGSEVKILKVTNVVRFLNVTPRTGVT